jgi:hypothetical protein
MLNVLRGVWALHQLQPWLLSSLYVALNQKILETLLKMVGFMWARLVKQTDVW